MSVPALQAAPPLEACRAAALWSLMLLTFSIGMGEFLIRGPLPEVATAGRLDPGCRKPVTAYVLGVSVGGPILVFVIPWMPRRRLVLPPGAVFVAATAFCALAPGSATPMARLLASLTLGT